MRNVAVVNQKGGSGKTTTVVNLAAALAEIERTVLIVDLDPQHSATEWLDLPARETEKGIYAVMVDNGNLLDIVYETDIENVDAIPSSDWLYGAEKALAGEVGAESILRTQLNEFPALWDYVLLDCPPNLGVLTVNALNAASEVLVPVEAHVLALSGLAQLTRTVDMVKQRLNPELEISGILPCRVDHRTNHAREVVDQLREHFGEVVFQTVIRESIRVAECPSFHQPITVYASASSSATDYRELAREIIQQEVKVLA